MFLTPAEILALTGYIRPSSQCAWLTRNGWKFEVDGNGRPVVLRSYAESRMDGREIAVTPKPHFDRIRQAG